ncbi:GmrSD restriction endonuclease domain-containing protein [Clostridium botulinum]|uniref:GmrSD restriction endonuclease domain-containing protein n=1 Tax=Clostridium botulinum TaxID=1491 RepID=UPI0019687C03|nr:DUF262 domain-containing protein [Clostridium botulinum]
MSITPRGMSIMEAYRNYRGNKLIVNRKYQRKLVWSLDEKKALIESILKGYPIPLILLAEKEKEEYEIIDGMQRLNALFAFIENEFAVNLEGKEVYFDIKFFPFASNVSDKGMFKRIIQTEEVNFLDEDNISKFLEYQLPISIYFSKSEEAVNDIFKRINSFGRHLSPQEVRQAGVLTVFADLVRKLSAELRGDDTKDALFLTEMPEVSVDSKSLKLGYRVKAEEIFWCTQGIINIPQLRDSEDEQLIADIILSIVLEQPFAASRENLDSYYGKGAKDNSNEVDIAINKYGGPENVRKDIKIVYSKIKEIMDNDLSDKRLKNILNPNAGSNPVKEPFYTVFMSFYKLMIQEEKEPFNIEEIFNGLYDLAGSLARGSHQITTAKRKKNIGKCYGLIQDYFKKSDNIYRSSGTLSLDFENYLKRSKVEAPMYDFKQGLYDLEDGKRKLNEDMFEKIMCNIAAFANLGKDKVGFLFLGVTDKEQDTKRVEKLDDLTNVPRIEEFGVVGLEREAKIRKVSLDRYITFITERIKNSELPEWLKVYVNTNVTPVTYRGHTVLIIKVKSNSEPVWYKDKLYIRDGSNCKEVVGKDTASVYNLFK